MFYCNIRSFVNVNVEMFFIDNEVKRVIYNMLILIKIGKGI